MVSKILLGETVWSSLRWLLEATSLWIWNRALVFRWRPFFWSSSICMTSWIFPKECIWWFKYCANFEVWLLFRNERLCSLYLVMKLLSVCPMYAFLQLGQVNLCTPESGWSWDFTFLSKKIRHLYQLQQPPVNKNRWITFTNIGKETTHFTNVFKHTNIRITCRTINALQNHLSHNNRSLDKYSFSGVYKLTCPNCKKAYVGQTSRNFITRYNERKRSFRNNSQ